MDNRLHVCVCQSITDCSKGYSVLPQHTATGAVLVVAGTVAAILRISSATNAFAHPTSKGGWKTSLSSLFFPRFIWTATSWRHLAFYCHANLHARPAISLRPFFTVCFPSVFHASHRRHAILRRWQCIHACMRCVAVPAWPALPTTYEHGGRSGRTSPFAVHSARARWNNTHSHPYDRCIIHRVAGREMATGQETVNGGRHTAAREQFVGRFLCSCIFGNIPLAYRPLLPFCC